MGENKELLEKYLVYCSEQKRLDEKTVRAYGIDLRQFFQMYEDKGVDEINRTDIEEYIRTLHRRFKPRTVKRKVASVKAFFGYLEYQNRIGRTPWYKLYTRFREPQILPRVIPLQKIECLLRNIYTGIRSGKTEYKRKNALRDAAVCELLFATGMRISELCALKERDIDLLERKILIWGKGAKERIIHIGNEEIVRILDEYRNSYREQIREGAPFFVNQAGNPFSDQAIRRMIRRYAQNVGIESPLTPHMFRHTFATSLLDAGVDIRYIQGMLGHSSIHTTEIYTHVSMAKQRDILNTMHPRNEFQIEADGR